MNAIEGIAFFQAETGGSLIYAGELGFDDDLCPANGGLWIAVSVEQLSQVHLRPL
jgi:hypothetical protein